MSNILMGRALRYGDDINTDVIIPTKYSNTTDPKELGKYCLINLDPLFQERKQLGDILVVGKNFGCGSSREHAPLAIKGAGISCVIANSFARIFFRNAIDMGLPVIESPEIVEETTDLNDLEINFESFICRNVSTGKQYSIPQYPEVIQKIFLAGGLINYLTRSE
ncbi:3-isopropylmalate dehydratase small subunit [Heliobacterium gestii]|uniref:3-isopropylmalate dehydratase small subunit n=1 Tax=Heliomicrobium gestii TaxID=2699 RepID=A0A845LE29_HELGE|nr:3-isopropylmalate dehydratase small subunit [Heliomicrobium gestii]MBM7865949.1 3-isopropylmalate/(R)-2-methylmalate dehydratase small subunit [Heliomicrobium gestii]MZP42715.1 3-isopropylmalate dehydratase small subunit [Heliomicrobium gestii]